MKKDFDISRNISMDDDDVGNTSKSRRGMTKLASPRAPYGPAGLVVENVFLHNTKITSSAMNEKKAHKIRRGREHRKGRAISITEACSLMLGYPQV
jgi:hypothetical protein